MAKLESRAEFENTEGMHKTSGQEPRVYEAVDALASEVTHKLSGVASDVAKYARAVSEGTGARVRDAAEQVPEVIRRYPIQSLAVGFGVGFLAALLIQRSR